MAYYAIGDIHGYSSSLDLLVSQVNFNEDDKIVFIGDYVDKGPDASGTIDLLLNYQSRYNCIFLRGNHDQSFIEACSDPNKFDAWHCLAGNEPLRSYSPGPEQEVIKSIPDKHQNFLKSSCKDYHETKNFIFVHAGIRSQKNPNRETVERLHWYSLSSASPHFSGKTVVCGHSTQYCGNICDLGHTICIDTGITRGGWLSCINLDDFSFTQVSSNLEVRNGMLR